MRPARFQPSNEPVPTFAGVRKGFRHGTGFAGAFATLLLSFFYAPAGAEPVAWVPSPAQPVNRVSEDLELGLRARKALLQDQELAGQILGLSIRNRVATLWGTASSVSITTRAEDCLRNLPGLSAIRSELYIDTRAEPQVERYTLPGDQSRIACGQPQLPDTRPVPGALVHRTGEQAPALGQEFFWRPAERKRTDDLPPRSTDQLVEKGRMPDKPETQTLPGFPSQDSTRTPSQSAASNVPPSWTRPEAATLVMPAIILPVAPTAAERARAMLPSSPARSQNTSSLVQGIEALRLADDRFRGIHVDVRGDAVYLRGMVYRWEHLFELARLVSRLPGVRRVLFEDVRAESP